MKSEFSLDVYADLLEQFRNSGGHAPRAQEPVPEVVVQQFWYDYAALAGNLQTLEGHTLEVISPGWWNHCAGPDFQGAQLRFNGALCRGDVEVHVDQPNWQSHGHHQDPRYNNVRLHAVLHPARRDFRVETAAGRAIPHLELGKLSAAAGHPFTKLPDVEEFPDLAPRAHGSCNRFLASAQTGRLKEFVRLSGDWRLLNKARRLEDRVLAVGVEQAAYEALSRALGYLPYVEQFERLAHALPIERASQLASQAPHLLEAALLHLAGLLPDAASAVQGESPHCTRLNALRAEYLPTLRPLAITWPLAGVRPNNYPHRRIAGLAAVVGRTGARGLARHLEECWHEHTDPVPLRRAFEALFPGPVGFWSRHFRFDGDPTPRAAAVIGAGRARSIIGNVFVPLALAQARSRGDQAWEERVFSFYRRLPAEPPNQVYTLMIPRVFGEARMPLPFHMQQGLLQMYDDWCRNNPSCRNCPILAYLDSPAAAGSAE